MRVSCVCPTYKRPDCLANVVACFEAQTYEECELIVFDDAGQYSNEPTGYKWRIHSTRKRFPTLQQKYNALIGMAQGDLICIWEDDDTYLPDHVELIVEAALEFSADFITPSHVWSNYGGAWNNENATGRFHGSWAFTRVLWQRVGGYKDKGLISDQQFRVDALKLVPETKTSKNTYIFRWGNGVYHGQQLGEEGYEKLMLELEDYPFLEIFDFSPKFDDYSIDRIKYLGYDISSW